MAGGFCLTGGGVVFGLDGRTGGGFEARNGVKRCLLARLRRATRTGA